MSNKMTEAVCKFSTRRIGTLERLYFWLMMIVSAMAGVALTLSMLTGQSIVEQNKMQEIYDQSLQHIKQEADARVQEANEKFKAIIDRLPPSVVTSAVRGAKIEIKP